MTINRVEIKEFLVFNGEFSIDFCTGVNVIIGGNGTGKTTLLEILNCETSGEFLTVHQDVQENKKGESQNYYRRSLDSDVQWVASPNITGDNVKTMLSTAKGKKKTMFITTDIHGLTRDIIEKTANKEPVNRFISVMHEIEKSVGIKDIIRTGSLGPVVTYVMKSNGDKILLAYEASGFQKFSLLYMMLKFGFIDKDSVLFWDEPENSLNPELIPVLVDVLLELSRNGVQIFIATHNEILANYFAVNRKRSDEVMFHSFYKEGSQVKVDTNTRFDFLDPNNLSNEAVNLYKRQIVRGMSGNE